MAVKRLAAALFAGVVLSGGLAACGSSNDAEVVEGPWEDVIAAAESEGEVNFYTALPQVQTERLVAAFGAEYPGISVEVTRGGGDLPARVEAEMASGTSTVDVYAFSDPNWFSGRGDELLSVDGPSAEGWDDSAWIEDENAVMVSQTPYIFLWNTDQFPDGFEDWSELLDSSLEGKIGVRSDMVPSNAGYFDFLENELGADYLTDLGKMNSRFYASVVPMGQAVASGEIGMTFTSTPPIVRGLEDAGAPVGWALPSPGFSVENAAAGLATASNPNAARVFLDFMMSEAGQLALNGEGLGGPGRAGIEGSLDLSDTETLDSSQYSPERLSEAEAEFRSRFN